MKGKTKFVPQHFHGKSPISGVESVTGNISPTIVANIVIASMIVTSERENIVIVIVTNIVTNILIVV